MSEQRDNIDYWPKGSMILFSGDVIPEGYALCDGKNGTPNAKYCIDEDAISSWIETENTKIRVIIKL
jgi:hypothetical protein